MLATDRVTTEQLFHDEQANERRDWFAAHPEKLSFDEEWFLNHETWVRPALARLGDVQGSRVLDYGCGHGMASLVLAHRGAVVTALDLSPAYLAEAAARARVNHAAIRFVQACGERLPFADTSFDRVWGSAILHHLDLPRAAAELRRILKPGGNAVFCEPWGGNPLLEWARRRLAYPGKRRSLDERPLRQDDLEVLRRCCRRQ
jgi:SAM-dependent methyltransferase